MYKRTEMNQIPPGVVYFPHTFVEHRQIQDADRRVFYAYAARIYRKFGHGLKIFSDADLSLRHSDYYFQDSHYIPHFLQYGYDVRSVFGTSLTDFLKEVKSGQFVIMAIKDDGSQGLDDESLQALRELGVAQLSRESLYASYIWCAECLGDGTFRVHCEAADAGPLHWEGTLGEKDVYVISQGAQAGNHSAIYLDGVQLGRNMRGLNVVVFDAHATVVDSHNFDTFATIYGEDSLFCAIRPTTAATAEDDSVLVSHAGGELAGIRYTNCKEALALSYAQRGHRFFELDFELTSDNVLVARHDWQDYLYKHLGQTKPEGLAADAPASYAWFASEKILGQYTPMSIQDVLEFLVRHKDAFLVTDTKHLQPAQIKQQFEKILEAASTLGWEVLNRIIPQLYATEMLAVVEQIYAFPQYILTLYQTTATNDEVVEFVKQQPITFVTMSEDRYSSEFVAALRSVKVRTYVHTINDIDVAKRYLANGVFGFYTDILTRGQIALEKRVSYLEMNIRVKTLRQFSEKFAGITALSEARLASLSCAEIESLMVDLFGARTSDGVSVLLSDAGLT